MGLRRNGTTIAFSRFSLQAQGSKLAVVPRTNETTLVWVSPQRLLDRWQPEMFRPEYRELDRILAQPSEFVNLGELVQVVRQGSGDVRTKWHIDPSGVTRRFQGQDADTAASLPDTTLPDEALLVSRSWGQNPVIRYWNARLFHGNATAGWRFIALSSGTGQSIAWLRRELESEYGRLQLNRRALAVGPYHLSVEDLLTVQVRRLSQQEQELAGHEIYNETIREASALWSRRLSKTFVLTGRTFESRLRQFEEYLVTESLFSAADAFFVEPATRTPNSDLFVVRPLIPVAERRNDVSSAIAIMPQDSSATNEAWRSWFWNSSETEHHLVFNSFLFNEDLPTDLMRRLAMPLPAAVIASDPKLLPSFSTFRDAVFPSIKADVGVEEQIWADVWSELQGSYHLQDQPASHMLQEDFANNRFEFEQELFAWSRQVYRPVLAIKVRRSGVAIGAYLLLGDDQVDDWASAYTKLDDLGISLGEVLHPPPEIMDDVTRQESLRRLSSVMHQIKGPAGRAINALADVKEFLDRSPDVAAQLVPDAVRAERRARMPGGASLDRQTLAARIADAHKAVSDVKKIAYQLIRLRRVQGDLEKRAFRWFRLDQLLSNCARTCLEGRPEITVDVSIVADVEVWGSEESIKYAIDEVLSNACREVLEHDVSIPTIRINCGINGNDAWLQVSDNGLSEDKSLIPDPFDEGVSGYERSGRGFGFGLPIVRDTFRLHGGDCSLTENFDDELRARGVTFLAHMPVSTQGEHDT